MENVRQHSARRFNYTVHMATGTLFLRDGCKGNSGLVMTTEEIALGNCMAAFNKSEEARKLHEKERATKLANTRLEKVLRIALCFFLPLALYAIAAYRGAVR